MPQEIAEVMKRLAAADDVSAAAEFGSAIFAEKPGDGSAREQAASCQRVLGGRANIVRDFATKRYRSNCINWGILPLSVSKEESFDYQPGDYVFIPGIRKAIAEGISEIPAYVITEDKIADITLFCENLSEKERQIILDGCLMNYYAAAANKD